MEIKTQTKHKQATNMVYNLKNVNLFLKGFKLDVSEASWGDKDYLKDYSTRSKGV